MRHLLYLIFVDDEKLDLTKWVFAIEAHPMKVMAEQPTNDAIKRWQVAGNWLL
ncbi:hypothetical protein T492DRAFT_855702 [Pavlovales sp. CCMP2436]|nr:hypothetical protein T492DRAFT_855702 [Pavlovales sp. CCMP2436]